MKAPQKNETEPAYDPASRPPGINPKEVRTDLTSHLYTHIHSGVTHGSPAAGAAQVSIVDNTTDSYPPWKGDADTCSNMDALRGRRAK